MKDVMTLLKKKIRDSHVDFISVAGDNYYPKKGKKKDGTKEKIIDTYDLYSGFKELPDKPNIYMILGNHDLEKNNDDKQPTLFINNNKNPESNCEIVTLEQNSVRDMSNIYFKLFEVILMRDDTLVMMIDTSMYENKDKPKHYLECHNKFLRRNFRSDKDLRAYQQNLISTHIRSYLHYGIKNLIIIGHHPIIGLKRKKKKGHTLNDIPLILPVLEKIYEHLPNVNFCYLCADLHMYQEGEISIEMPNGKVMIIEQHIVGTGGAELDDDLGDIERDTEQVISIQGMGSDIVEYTVSYKMIQSVRSNGFLECELPPELTHPVFKFHRTDDKAALALLKRTKRRKQRRTQRRKQKKNTIRTPRMTRRSPSITRRSARELPRRNSWTQTNALSFPIPEFSRSKSSLYA
jgi:hypothetical protein